NNTSANNTSANNTSANNTSANDTRSHDTRNSEPPRDNRTMTQAKKPKVVLFLPSRVDPEVGDLPSADLLPLEMLHIAPTAERAIRRDGQAAHPAPRATVHLNELREPSFHLIDLQKYYDLQKRTAKFGNRVRNRLPPPHHLAGKPHRGFSYFSSFGCPEPCS